MKKWYLFLILVMIHNTRADNSSALDIAIDHQQNERFTQAIMCYENIIAHNAQDTQAFFNLGCCHLAIGNFGHAITAFNNTIRLYPTSLPAFYNLGYTYKTAGYVPQAIDMYKKIILANENYEPAQLALGFAYLINGDFDLGWSQHKRYLKKSGKNGDALRHLLKTNNVAGKKILLTPEGGLGDTLHFIRYAELLHSMGAHVTVCTQKPLFSLLAGCPYINELVLPYSTSVSLYDAQASLMSLPAIFKDNEQTLPKNIPYITAHPQLVKEWKQKLAHDNQYKIGICWQADKHNDISRLPIARRGCPLSYFEILQNVNGISLYSLQKYDGVEELATMPASFSITVFNDLDEKSGPFMDSAALIENLDLIITVDTAVAHLAGALGHNVWLLLPYSTDWRWIINRTDSPWYPTMRIFKQPKPFDWDSVLKEVAKELQKILITK